MHLALFINLRDTNESQVISSTYIETLKSKHNYIPTI